MREGGVLCGKGAAYMHRLWGQGSEEEKQWAQITYELQHLLLVALILFLSVMHMHFPMTISLKGRDGEKYFPVPSFQDKISTGISAEFSKARA